MGAVERSIRRRARVVETLARGGRAAAAGGRCARPSRISAAEELARLVSMLRVAHVVSIGGGRVVDSIELYHDRVRDGGDGAARRATLRARHRAIALALEHVAASRAGEIGAGADAEALALALARRG